MTRRTFIFHKDWYDAISYMSQIIQPQAIRALCDFGFTGIKTTTHSAEINKLLDLAEARIAKDYARFVEYMIKNKYPVTANSRASLANTPSAPQGC